MHIGKLEGITPTVNFASRSIALGGMTWGVRIIPDYQLFFVVSGHAELVIGQHEQKHTIRAGDCVYYGPDCSARLSVIEATDYFSIHFQWHSPSPQPIHPGHRILFLQPDDFSGEPRNPTLEIAPYGEIAMPTFMSVSGLEPIFTKMVKEYELEQPGHSLVLRGLMMQVVSTVFRQLLGTGSHTKPYGKIDPAIQAMSEQPEKNWTVNELAALCGYHPIHFAKLFKDEVGVAPKHYMIGERIKKAKRALLQGEKVEKISRTLGFTSIHYFSHQFKQATGLSPTEFRLHGKSGE